MPGWEGECMQHTAAILGFVGGALVGFQTSALAQPLPPSLTQADLARLAADLSYPNSARRFFEAGDTQLEREIQRMLDQDEDTEPQLTVDPAVLEQFEDETHHLRGV